MKQVLQKVLAATALLTVAAFISSFQTDNGVTISEFSLRNVDGKNVAINDYTKAKGFIVIFTCNHCPFAKLYTQRLNDLNTKYKALQVPLLAINSMDSMVYEDENFENMQSKAKNEAFNFPYLQDAMQKVGKKFDAEHTPTAYVIWKENNVWKIKYKGAIDDNGEHPELATSFIGNAVDDLLSGKSVAKPETESFGCRIFYRE